MPLTTPQQQPFHPFWRALLRRVRPQRIGQRLALGFGALVVLMLLALGYAALPLSAAIEATQRFANGDMQRLLRVQSLSLQTEGVGGALVRLMNAPRDHRVAEYTDVDARNRRIDGIIDSLTSELDDPVQEATLQRLRARRANYGDAFIATVDQVEAGDLKAAATVLNAQVNPALSAMLKESDLLLQRERDRVETQLQEAQRQFRNVALGAAIGSLLAILAAAVLAWRTTRSVVRPLAALETAARHIAQGDYTVRVPATFTEEVDRVGDALNTMADAVAQRELQNVRLAYQDAMTGLPNRTALLEPLHDTTPQHNTLALIDLARLKAINETLGYTTGDTLIRELALRTARVFEAAAADGQIGPEPVVARLSGGTIAAYFSAPSRDAVEALRGRLEQALANAVPCSGHSVDLATYIGFADSTAGIGISTDIDTDIDADTPGKPVGTLMRNAEIALHSAKRAAISHAWYSELQEAARLSHLSLVSDLRQAVADSQLQMWLQPKFCLQSGRAIGGEALVRWQHPLRGFISPAEFLPFAEQTGHITMLTEWMLREALRTLQLWRATQPDLSIAVNVSTRDLQDADFAQRVQRLLGEHTIDPTSLCLEITESGLMEDAQRGIALLQSLRNIGVKLAIDDFGTGYSSLAYLQKLPVNELKIDRSFVDRIDTQPGTQKLVKAMIEMGHGMDLMVTAEGVETEAERATLQRLGADVMQGYLRSRPLHGAALQSWFEAL